MNRRHRWLWRVCCCLLLLWSMAGCAASLYLPQVTVGQKIGTEPLPDRPLYVLATTIKGEDGYQHNELVTVDPATWQVAQRTELPQGTPWNIDRDPQGRLWVGYATMPGQGDNRVVVLTPDGSIEKILRPCADPSYGIHFSDEYAFVPCAMNGFYSLVTVLDLDTFALVQTLELRTDDTFSLIASSSNGTTLLAYGVGLAENLVTVDLATQTIQGYYPLPPANVAAMESYDDKFYILNVYSYQAPDETSELFVLNTTGSVTVTPQSLAVKGPTWGVVADQQLYTYHDPTYGTTVDTPFRAIARLDLESGKTAWWPLPDYWRAGDIGWVDGQILLTHDLYNDAEQVSGLYAFNPESGDLTQLVYIPGAERLVTPAP